MTAGIAARRATRAQPGQPWSLHCRVATGVLTFVLHSRGRTRPCLPPRQRRIRPESAAESEAEVESACNALGRQEQAMLNDPHGAGEPHRKDAGRPYLYRQGCGSDTAVNKTLQTEAARRSSK